jgi:hypothetical protein
MSAYTEQKSARHHAGQIRRLGHALDKADARSGAAGTAENVAAVSAGRDAASLVNPRVMHEERS